jgi:carbonic anhydrase/acetyltransferase-like protein (isoleucine patch superfamily)
MMRAFKDILPQIDSSTYVEESANIIGDVIIGEKSSIWFNSVIRGDVNYIRIGSKTNIQDSCVLHVTKDTHPLVVGNEVTVGHNVTLHGCTVKDRCLIGMGAIILDGAEVGEDSMVAAGCLVKQGMIVPPKTLVVGVPARIARPLTEKEIKRIKQSAQNYIDYANSYQT